MGLLLLSGAPEYHWIVATPFVETDPAFSPDGRWPAYVSTESGQQQIYVRPYPTGGGRWQISDGTGGFPRWARDGRELFYRSDTGIMAASVEVVNGSLRTGKPRQLFTGGFRGGAGGLGIASNVFADYDVAPDGQSFVMFPLSGSTGWIAPGSSCWSPTGSRSSSPRSTGAEPRLSRRSFNPPRGTSSAASGRPGARSRRDSRSGFARTTHGRTPVVRRRARSAASLGDRHRTPLSRS